jgi:hypothetical protein
MNEWMKSLPATTKALPLNRIILPGTHDSGTSLVSYSTEIFTAPVSCIKPVQNGFDAWVTTQSQTVLQQLQSGIRSLDLRITYGKPVTKWILGLSPIEKIVPTVIANELIGTEYYITHTFVCETLNSVLNQIQTFIHQQPTEIIVLEVTPDFGNEGDITADIDLHIISLFTSQFGSLLIPQQTVFPTYNSLIAARQQIIFSYIPVNSIPENPLNWNSSYFNIPWDNTSTLSIKENDMDIDMSQFQLNDSVFNAVSFILTPQTSDVVKDIIKRVLLPCCCNSLDNSVEKMAAEIDTYFNSFVIKYNSKLNYLSAILFDFPQTSLIQQVINFNN